MKKKAIFLLFILFTVIVVHFKVQASYTAPEGDAVRIPDEAIRLRILADSNSERDQTIKREVRDAVNAAVLSWVGELTDLHKARKVIKAHLPEIKATVADTLEKFNAEQSYKVAFGKVAFPTKMYGNFVYPAGTYEAVLVTLGEGGGANWWCVLFPPLCFLDFENGDAVKRTSTTEPVPDEPEKDNSKDAEAKFFLIEWMRSLIDKIIDFLKNL